MKRKKVQLNFILNPDEIDSERERKNDPVFFSSRYTDFHCKLISRLPLSGHTDTAVFNIIC